MVPSKGSPEVPRDAPFVYKPRARIRIVEPLAYRRAGRPDPPDAAEFTCDGPPALVDGVLVIFNAVSDKGNPNEPTAVLLYWPPPGTFISSDQMPREL